MAFTERAKQQLQAAALQAQLDTIDDINDPGSAAALEEAGYTIAARSGFDRTYIDHLIQTRSGRELQAAVEALRLMDRLDDIEQKLGEARGQQFKDALKQRANSDAQPQPQKPHYYLRRR